MDRPVLSVVVPMFDESAVLDALVARLRPALDGLGEPYEVVAVDDGSRDDTAARLVALAAEWPQLRVRVLARNVGHQLALTAGLDVAAGEYVVTMDADLQDPPELIPEMLHRARADGVDVVYARRSERRHDTWFKRVTAAAYYRVIRRASRVDVPEQVGDFRLLSRRVVGALAALPERHRVYRLLIPWLGFPSATVEHARAPRAAGSGKYSLGRMLVLAANGITSFSTAPLRLATALGLVTATVSLLAAFGAVAAFTIGHTVPGWASLTVGMLFLGAVQLICLGVLGEYVGRIFEEVQRRPLYTVERDSAAAPVTARDESPA